MTRRKNRLRGKKAHRTALLNKALRALNEKNGLPTCGDLTKLNGRIDDKLEHPLISSHEKVFSELHSYQDEFSLFNAKSEVLDSASKFDSKDAVFSYISFEEKCMAPQIKAENGHHIKVEMTDETTQEGYDGEFYSNGELVDPLLHMTIKIEPPDDIVSSENSQSCNSINIASDSVSVANEEKTDNSSCGTKDVLSGRTNGIKTEAIDDDIPLSVLANGIKTETIDDDIPLSVLAKQLKSSKSEVHSYTGRTKDKLFSSCTSLLDPYKLSDHLNSVYHIIKDTDSSLTCKFVKSELLKEENNFADKKCFKSEKNHVENVATCIKGEEYEEEYESDNTLPVDAEDESVDSKEGKDSTEKAAYVKTHCQEGTSLLLEGFEDSNSSSVRSTVEGDFTPYEDYTLAQVNEEDLLKRLVFEESNEEEALISESDKNDRREQEELSCQINSIKKEQKETAAGKENISTKVEEKVSEVKSGVLKDSSALVDRTEIMTKQFSINVERIDCTKNLEETKTTKATFCPNVREAEKELNQRPSSEAKGEKPMKEKSKQELTKLRKARHDIIHTKKPGNKITKTKKSKIEIKLGNGITTMKKSKSEVTEWRDQKFEPSRLKKSKSENVESAKSEFFRKSEKAEGKKPTEEEQFAPLYVRPKRRKLSFQEKLDEPQNFVWDSDLLPHPSVLSTVSIKKIKQIKIKKKKPVELKLEDKELQAGVASAKQRLAKKLSKVRMLSAPIQKFSVEGTAIKNNFKKLEKCETDDDSVNELEQIIEELSGKDEVKSSRIASETGKKIDLEKIETELEDKIESSCQLLEPVPVPKIDDALLEEILTTGFTDWSGGTQICIEPVKPKYRVVTAPPPFPKPSVPFNLDYLVTRIGSWNVAWLEEQIINTEPPPDITYYARNPILSYVCYDEYFDVYYPFLMLEIWQFIFESWQKKRYVSDNVVLASVTSHEIEDDVLILQCKVTLDSQTSMLDFPFEGHLVILKLNLHGCEGHAQVFGYVTDHRIEEILPVGSSGEKANITSVVVSLTIKTKVRMGNPDFESVIMIEHLCLFKLYVLEFEALVNLHKNELVCSILRPQEISYISKQEKAFLSLGSYSAEQQSTILDLSRLINSPDPSISFVSGAPGSGKTHTLVGLVQQLLCEDGHGHNVKLLVVSQTHGGINDIGCRLVKLQHLFKRSNKRELRLVRVGNFECTHPGLQAHCIDSLVKYNLERNKEELRNAEIKFHAIEGEIAKLSTLLINCKPHSDEIHTAQHKLDKLLLEKRQLMKKIDYYRNKMSIDEEERKSSMRLEILQNADVILTTVQECRSSSLVSAYGGDGPCHFKCCIVDDATQLTELQMLTLLLYDIRKLILFGDTQQLIPKVKSVASREYGYQLSYFERCQLYFQNLSDVPPCNYCVLREQFRMNSDMSYFPSSYFYGEKIITPPNIDKYHSFPKLHSCVIFDITDGVQSMDMLNICNLPEAKFVIKIISELSKFIKCKWNVGIIASCWGQCEILQKLLTTELKIKHDVEIGTVDYFQGHEKDVIILSCVQTKHREGDNFLSCPHLFNLAITRAQKLLIVCGTVGFLKQWTHWKEFLKYAIQKKVFFRTNSTSTNIMLHLTNSGHNWTVKA